MNTPASNIANVPAAQDISSVFAALGIKNEITSQDVMALSATLHTEGLYNKRDALEKSIKAAKAEEAKANNNKSAKYGEIEKAIRKIAEGLVSVDQAKCDTLLQGFKAFYPNAILTTKVAVNINKDRKSHAGADALDQKHIASVSVKVFEAKNEDKTLFSATLGEEMIETLEQDTVQAAFKEWVLAGEALTAAEVATKELALALREIQVEICDAGRTQQRARANLTASALGSTVEGQKLLEALKNQASAGNALISQ